MYNRIAEGWVLSAGATPQQQALGLRFLLAVLTCWQFEYPLTEEAFIESVQRCVMTPVYLRGSAGFAGRSGVKPSLPWASSKPYTIHKGSGIITSVSRRSSFYQQCQHIAVAGGPLSTGTQRLPCPTLRRPTRPPCSPRSGACMRQACWPPRCPTLITSRTRYPRSPLASPLLHTIVLP